MHKYQPRFHVILVEPELELTHHVDDIVQEHFRENMRTFVFPETQFMAVTAYQNHMVSLNHQLVSQPGSQPGSQPVGSVQVALSFKILCNSVLAKHFTMTCYINIM